MRIPSNVYDALKWLLLIVIPAFEVCLKAVATACGWQIDVENINTVISAIAAFVGVCIGISTNAYNLEDKKKDIVDKIEKEL